MAEKLNNFEKFEKKKIKFQPCSQPRDLLLMTGQMPQTTQPQNLVDNEYTKLGKTSKNLLLSQGLSYIKIPLCQGPHYTFETMGTIAQLSTNRRTVNNDNKIGPKLLNGQVFKIGCPKHPQTRG